MAHRRRIRCGQSSKRAPFNVLAFVGAKSPVEHGQRVVNDVAVLLGPAAREVHLPLEAIALFLANPRKTPIQI
jgi:hypothetical protein